MSNRGLQVLEGFIKMPFLVIILIAIVIYVFVKSGGEHLVHHWTEHRDNPAVAAGAGALGKDSSHNLKGIFYTKFKVYFGFLMKPVQYVMKIIHTILGKLVNSINLFRAILKPIRMMFKAAGQMFYNKLNQFAGMIVYFFAKIRDTLRRLAGVFQLTLYTLQAMQLSLKSIWDGPIGEVSRDFAYAIDAIRSFFCLHGDTPIQLHDGRFLPLRIIPIGTMLQTPSGPSKLIGIAQVRAKGLDLYKYKDCLMSGSHLVFYQQKWVRAKSFASFYGNSVVDYLYCPITENNTVMTPGGVLLRDYEEVSGRDINKKLLVHSLRHLNILNNWSLDQLGPVSKSTQGISGQSLVNLSQGGQCRAEEITIGTELEEGGRVEGIIVFQAQDKCSYSISDTLEVTGRQIIQVDRCWQEASRFVWNQKNIIGNPCFYGFLTEKGYLKCGETLLADVCDGLSPLAMSRQEQIISDELGIQTNCF